MTPPIDDIDRVMAVMAAAFDPVHGEAWTRGQVESALLLGSCRTLLIAPDGHDPVEGQAAAGFALLRTTLDEEELLLFAIDPKWRRRGLGSRLLSKAIAGARAAGMKRMLLEMRRGNEAENLYRKAGFEAVGIRKNYYRSGLGSRVDAITFSCDFD